MIILGLLLMLGCTALAVDAVVQNTAIIHTVAFNRGIPHLSTGALFVAGAVLGLLFALGLMMVAGGINRSARRRRERRVVATDAQAETEALRAEKLRLERELKQRPAAPAYPVEPASTAATDGRLRPAGRHRH